MSDPIRIEGKLREDARLLFTPGGAPQAVLCMELETGAGYAFLVRQNLGTDITAQEVARAKLSLLKRGALAYVYARGIRPQTDHGVAALALLSVNAVHPLGFPDKQAS